MKARVYTETTVHTAAVPYQIAIVELEDGSRKTVRIEGDRVAIGDPVECREDRATASARTSAPRSGESS